MYEKNAKQKTTQKKIGLVSQKYYSNQKLIAHLFLNENYFQGY